MVNNYIPRRGDLVWLNFNPQTGKEQAGKRPAIVISPESYNEKTNLALVCPITSKIKNYPFEVVLKSKKISGAVLADHIKNLDWKAREAKFIEKASPSTIKKVQSLSKALIAN